VNRNHQTKNHYISNNGKSLNLDTLSSFEELDEDFLFNSNA